MIALPWVGSVALLAILAQPSVASLPPVAPSSTRTLPITGEAPLLIDADGYMISISEIDEAD